MLEVEVCVDLFVDRNTSVLRNIFGLASFQQTICCNYSIERETIAAACWGAFVPSLLPPHGPAARDALGPPHGSVSEGTG